MFYVLQVNLSWYLLMEFPNEVDHARSCGYLLLPNIIHYEGDGNLMAGEEGGRDHHSVVICDQL